MALQLILKTDSLKVGMQPRIDQERQCWQLAASVNGRLKNMMWMTKEISSNGAFPKAFVGVDIVCTTVL